MGNMIGLTNITTQLIDKIDFNVILKILPVFL